MVSGRKKVFLDGGSQSYQDRQKKFHSWHKVNNIASIDITLMSLLQYLDIFLESFKNGVHKNLTKSTKNNLNHGPLCNKAGEWRSATFSNRDSGTDALPRIFQKLQEHLFCKRSHGQISFRHPKFWVCNFTCAPHRTRKKYVLKTKVYIRLRDN